VFAEPLECSNLRHFGDADELVQRGDTCFESCVGAVGGNDFFDEEFVLTALACLRWSDSKAAELAQTFFIFYFFGTNEKGISLQGKTFLFLRDVAYNSTQPPKISADMPVSVLFLLSVLVTEGHFLLWVKVQRSSVFINGIAKNQEFSLLIFHTKDQSSTVVVLQYF